MQTITFFAVGENIPGCVLQAKFIPPAVLPL
jgi:hypothetical protein